RACRPGNAPPWECLCRGAADTAGASCGPSEGPSPLRGEESFGQQAGAGVAVPGDLGYGLEQGDQSLVIEGLASAEALGLGNGLVEALHVTHKGEEKEEIEPVVSLLADQGRRG